MCLAVLPERQQGRVEPHALAALEDREPRFAALLRPPGAFAGPQCRASCCVHLSAWASILAENEQPARVGRTAFSLDVLEHVLDVHQRADRVLVMTSQAFDFEADELPANVRYVGPQLEPVSQDEWSARSSSAARRR